MTIHRLLHTRLLTPKKEPFVLKTTTRRLPQYLTDEQPLLFLQRNYSSTRWKENWLLLYSKKWFNTANDKLHKKGNQPTGCQIKRKKYYTSECWKYSKGFTSTQKSRGYYNNCSSLWCWLQAADNVISDGFHLRDIFRESLLRIASGNPIANKGQVHGREKGLN